MEITSNTKFFASTIIPVLVKLYNNHYEKFSMPTICWLINDYESYLDVNKLYPFDNLGNVRGIDINESEIVEKYCKNVINRL